MPSSLCAAQNSVDAFRTSGNAEQNLGIRPHDSFTFLSCTLANVLQHIYSFNLETLDIYFTSVFRSILTRRT